MEDYILAILVLVFMTIPLFRWHAVYVLNKARRYAEKTNLVSGAIRERLIVASTGAIGSTILGFLGLNRLLGWAAIPVASPISLWLLVIALIMFAVPAVVWEWMYLTGRLER